MGDFIFGSSSGVLLLNGKPVAVASIELEQPTERHSDTQPFKNTSTRMSATLEGNISYVNEYGVVTLLGVTNRRITHLCRYGKKRVRKKNLRRVLGCPRKYII